MVKTMLYIYIYIYIYIIIFIDSIDMLYLQNIHISYIYIYGCNIYIYAFNVILCCYIKFAQKLLQPAVYRGVLRFQLSLLLRIEKFHKRGSSCCHGAWQGTALPVAGGRDTQAQDYSSSLRRGWKAFGSDGGTAKTWRIKRIQHHGLCEGYL